jgi:hypothetical protein
LEEAIRFDERVLDVGAATQKLRRMAEIEGRSGRREIGAYLYDKAYEYYQRGNQKTDRFLTTAAAFLGNRGDTRS